MRSLVNRSLERASVWLNSEQIRLEGILTQWDHTGIAIRFPTTAHPYNLLQPGTPVTLTLYSRRGTRQVEASVCAFRDEECHFCFEQGAMQELGRRRRARYPCHLPVEFCSLDAVGQEPTWHRATAVEIGMGGMHLVVEPETPIPGYLQVRFIPVGYNDPIYATARVAHCRASTDGTTVFGIAFEELSRLDQVWLERLVR